jgi:hypothetical protein
MTVSPAGAKRRPRSPAVPSIIETLPRGDRATNRPADVARPQPPRLVIPDSPPDEQAPAPSRERPSWVVMWFGDKSVPPSPATAPMQTAPPLTLYVQDLKRLFD